MKILGNDEVRGADVVLKAVNPRHIKLEKTTSSDDSVEKSFFDMLSGALGKVNNLQIEQDKLTQQMLVDPESVSIHSVMIASQKAELALSLAKSVTDRVVRAYNEITNMR